MILRETIMYECWCTECQHGQMEQIHDIMMSEKIPTQDMVGRVIVCRNCGSENVLEDVMVVIPAAYMVSSKPDLSKAKTNDDMWKWMNK